MPRIIFKKEDAIRYISHLDLMRTFQRMLMRADLPIKYSEGFNPHMILNFALPLSVGAVSDRDFCEIALTRDVKKEELLDKLKKAAPGGIAISDISFESTPDFREVAKAEFIVKVYSNVSKNEYEKFLSSESILTDKKTKKGIKEIDIKGMIYEYEIEEEEEYTKFRFLLAAGNTVNLNPSLIFKAAEKYIDGISVEYTDICRTNLYTEDGRCF